MKPPSKLNWCTHEIELQAQVFILTNCWGFSGLYGSISLSAVLDYQYCLGKGSFASQPTKVENFVINQ